MDSDERLRISVDIGGTFTDLVLESAEGVQLHKSPTVPDDPVQGVLDVIEVAARANGMTVAQLLPSTEQFIHATTRALNAVLTGTTARTAFLTTTGHPDVLLLREGGKADPFDFTTKYPDPYVPRALTFEIPERVLSTGEVLVALDEGAVIEVCRRLAELAIEAVAVCLLWSTVNPVHECRVGELLEQHLPGVAVSLSHDVNPSLREYRRASSTAIDASLKPIVTNYLITLTSRLREAGFAGKVHMVTSMGGILDIADVANRPINLVNSGPSMAPVAGRAYAAADGVGELVIVADAGGTTYDVTLVRHGTVPVTRDAWIGPRYLGHITGFPSVDVTSVGAGGGSIAWVDGGGLLHVGPQSAGSVPGPACYGRGGTAATLTDAALLLGYLDAASFSGGSMRLDPGSARVAVRTNVAEPLGLDDEAAADAIVRLTTEQMVRAIEDITLQQGIDPTAAVLVGGGGAAGINAAWVAGRLGCSRLLVPPVGAALAAAGALMSDLLASYSVTVPTTTDDFDLAGVNAALDRLRSKCAAFAASSGVALDRCTIDVFAEAHYPQQIWELEVPLVRGRFDTSDDVQAFAESFHGVHAQILGVADVASPVEVVSWGARIRCPLERRRADLPPLRNEAPPTQSVRPAHFAGHGWVDTLVCSPLFIGASGVSGPALVESAFTTVVVPPGMRCTRGASGSLLISPEGTT